MRLVAITAQGAPEEPGAAAVEAVVSEVLASTSALYARRGHSAPWHAYLALEDGRFVGTCAFIGPPENGEVEIAYFTFPAFEGRGVATRMVAAMLHIATATAERRSIRLFAHTLPEENRSTAVLRKFGFVRDGEAVDPDAGPVWRWCPPLQRAAANIRS